MAYDGEIKFKADLDLAGIEKSIGKLGEVFSSMKLDTAIGESAGRLGG